MTAPAPRKRRLPAPAPEPAADAVLLPPGQASKTLMILGLLRSGSKHGYELHRVIVAHGTLYADFKKPTQRALPTTTVSELKALHNAGQFPPGSMGPKVEAVIDYLEAGGDIAIICRPEDLALALDGKAGTRIYKD